MSRSVFCVIQTDIRPMAWLKDLVSSGKLGDIYFVKVYILNRDEITINVKLACANKE